MNYPETPRKSATDEYHSISVKEPYRWLEDNKARLCASGDPRIRYDKFEDTIANMITIFNAEHAQILEAGIENRR